MKNMVQDHVRVLSFLASEISFPAHSSGDAYTNIAGPQQGIATPINLVEGGDPVLIGRIPGVAAADALLSTGRVSVYIQGVFNLAVTPIHNGLSKGETVYADPSTLALSDDQTKTPFGYALDVAPATGTTTIRVLLCGPTPGATGAGS